MKFYLDTADIAEIEEAASWGVPAGVTTNPTLYSRIGGKLADFHAHLARIAAICADIERHLTAYHPDELRNSPRLRESVANQADDILRRMQGAFA